MRPRAWSATLSLVAVSAALVGAGFASAHPTTSPATPQRLALANLPVTPTVRSQLRGAFLRRNRTVAPASVRGPLWGRDCVEAMRELFRRRCIEHTQSAGRFYASALFVVSDDPVQSEDFRRSPRTRWTMLGGYGYDGAIPCAVLRAWGRRC